MRIKEGLVEEIVFFLGYRISFDRLEWQLLSPCQQLPGYKQAQHHSFVGLSVPLPPSLHHCSSISCSAVSVMGSMNQSSVPPTGELTHKLGAVNYGKAVTKQEMVSTSSPN